MTRQPAAGEAGVDGARDGAGPAPPRTSRHLDLAGPAGVLEAILETPPGEPPAAAVICHPHPLHGGTMHNKVVYRAAKGAVAAGLPALRFNFRGVGHSAGRHDAGVGERGDVAAALDHLAATFPGIPLLAGGFSFGAAVGLRTAADDPRVGAMVGLGLPTTRSSFAFLEHDPRPLLLLHGDRDPFGAPEVLHALKASRRAATRLVIYPGEGHFLAGVLPAMSAEVTRFCAGLWATGPGS